MDSLVRLQDREARQASRGVIEFGATRKRHGPTIEHLAVPANVGMSTISRSERVLRIPGPENIGRTSKVLKVSDRRMTEAG